MRLTMAIGTLLMAGCAMQDDMADLRGKTAVLEIDSEARTQQIARLEAKNEELELRLKTAEININTLFEKKPAPEPAGQWVLWEKETPLTSQLGVGYKPDRPAGAYSSEHACAQTASDHVGKQEGREEGNLAFVSQGTYYPIRFTYTCLPIGVDPRIKR